jgi:hypothetical protein
LSVVLDIDGKRQAGVMDRMQHLRTRDPGGQQFSTESPAPIVRMYAAAYDHPVHPLRKRLVRCGGVADHEVAVEDADCAVVEVKERALIWSAASSSE